MLRKRKKEKEEESVFQKKIGEPKVKKNTKKKKKKKKKRHPKISLNKPNTFDQKSRATTALMSAQESFKPENGFNEEWDVGMFSTPCKDPACFCVNVRGPRAFFFFPSCIRAFSSNLRFFFSLPSFFFFSFFHSFYIPLYIHLYEMGLCALYIYAMLCRPLDHENFPFISSVFFFFLSSCFFFFFFFFSFAVVNVFFFRQNPCTDSWVNHRLTNKR
jgi:hypothetical protein